MQATAQQYREIAAAIERAATLVEGVACLDTIATASAEHRVSIADADTLTSFAFRRLQELTEEDPVAASEVILRQLLPACYKDGDRNYRLRTILSDWIEQYPDAERIVLRKTVLGPVLERLHSERSVVSAWILAHIGFGSPTVKQSLWSVAEGDDPTGDAALGVLAVIGPTAEERAAIIHRIVSRMPRRGPRVFDYPVQELADPAFLPMLTERLAEGTLEDAIPLNHLARMAARLPGDDALQGEILRLVREWANAGDEHRRRVIFFGTVFSSSNSPNSLRWLLDVLTDVDAALRQIVLTRLDECFRPGQMGGWSLEDTGRLEAVLLRDAVQPSNAQGKWVTSDLRLRDHAWSTALCLGMVPPVDWLQSALASEASQIAKHSLMDLAASVAFDPVPPAVAELMTERFEYRRGEDTGGLFSRMGAASVCRSSATPQAFDLLLSSGLTVDGEVLRSAAAAVGDLAVWLTHRGTQGIVDRLLVECERPLPHHRRTLAAAGLEAMALATLLPERYGARLAHLIDDDSLPPYVRSALVNGAGRLKNEMLSPELPATLLRSATAPAPVGHDDDDVGFRELGLRSWEALIRLDLWRHHEPLLVARLGLQLAEGRFTVAAPKNFDPHRAYLLAMLASADPKRFVAAAATVLRDASPEAYYQMAGILRQAGPVLSNSGFQPLQEAVADRVGAFQLPTSADTDLFATLAELAPHLYLQRRWEDQWDRWMPASRAAFAESLEAAAKGDVGGRLERARQLLLILVADASYAVRRTAFRSLSCLDPATLADHGGIWAKSEELSLLRRAAEAASWMPLDRTATVDNEILMASAENPEPSVRIAAKNETRAAQRRKWAGESLEIIKRARPDGNTWVREAYRHGQALRRTGDDRSVRELRRLARSQDLPPNVRHWLIRTAKETEFNWRKAVEKWPEPVEPLGTLEVVEALIRVGQSVSGRVNASMWQRFRQDPHGTNAWGGALTALDGGWTPALGIATDQQVTLEIDGRPPAEILIKTIFTASSGVMRAIVVGNGEYPSGQ